MLSRSSSTSNLRRSSILKPPKSRQPFQDVDFNASSADNSPECTKKRRVSFAEKKHVKEFCDLKEQGTIWDNTYEEADHNVSKLTEAANEKADNNNPQIEYCRNIDSPTEAADFDPRCSRIFVITDPKSSEHSLPKMSLTPNADGEPTYVVSRCQDTSNNQLSRTIYCEDTELDITEGIGGIEPTVSIKKNVDFEPSREIEKTLVFENSASDMKFTQVITGKIFQDITPLYVTDPENENINPFAENQTIIFEDSTMDLTLPKSNLIQGSDSIRITKTDDSVAPVVTGYHINDHLGSDYSESNYRAAQRSNKTIIFNDLGCEITKPIDSIIHRLPQVDLAENDEPPAEPSGDRASKINGVEIRADLSLRIPGENNCDVLEPRDKTIFFNDFGCEMTQAVDSLRPRLNRDENEKENESDQIVPFQSPEVNPKSDEFMGRETSGSEIPSSSCESGEVESRLKSKAENKNQTELANESAMDFTTAITRSKNHISEQNQAAALSEPDVHVVAMEAESNFEKRDDCSQTGMSFTKMISSELHGNQNKRPSESSEQIGSELCCNSLIDQNSESDMNLTEAAGPAAPYISHSNENLEDGNTSSNSVSSSTELQGNIKRKSSELMEEIEENKHSSSWVNNNSEHEFSLVQNLTCEKTVNLTSNCKRSKVADLNDAANCEQTENVCISPPKTFQMQEIQTAIFADTTTANDRITDSTDEFTPQDESTTLSRAQYSQKNDERSMIDEDAEVEAESIDGIAAEEEPSFFKTIIHEDEEMMELFHGCQSQSTFRNESNKELENSSGSDICLKKNDECCFVMFKEGLEKFAKSDKCIWQIRSVDTKRVLIDFISKSLVVVINLEENKALTAPHTIKEIKFVSLLSDSEDGDIALVHDILLKKLNPDQLKQRHRTTQDILSLLELIAQRVKLLIDFMYELENLRDFHITSRLGNRISIHLHSYRVQLAMKITVDVEPFEEVGPNDVTVECILGNIREKDIKQLISGVKKDHKFLTNYVNDIKEYIALVYEN